MLYNSKKLKIFKFSRKTKKLFLRTIFSHLKNYYISIFFSVILNLSYIINKLNQLDILLTKF